MSGEATTVHELRVRDLVSTWSKMFATFIISGFFWFFIFGASIAWVAGDFYNQLRPLIILSMTGGTLAFAGKSATLYWDHPWLLEKLQDKRFSAYQTGIIMTAVATWTIALILFSVTIAASLAIEFGEVFFFLALAYPFIDFEVFNRFGLSPAFVPVLGLFYLLIAVGVARDAVEEVRNILEFSRGRTGRH